MLLPPVQTLVASLIFAHGAKMQTNLASSSQNPDSHLESGFFFYSAVHSILKLALLNRWILRKHRPRPVKNFSRCKGCGIVMSKKLSLMNTSASSLKEA